MISGWYCEKRVCNGTGSPLRLLFIIESAYCGGMQYFYFLKVLNYILVS
jgi:hypothetical protein